VPESTFVREEARAITVVPLAIIPHRGVVWVVARAFGPRHEPSRLKVAPSRRPKLAPIRSLKLAPHPSRHPQRRPPLALPRGRRSKIMGRRSALL
jgi:hypothetical protein